MIRESLFFSFDGRKSTDFPIVNVNVGSGLYSESVASGKRINETQSRNAFKPYFFGVQRHPKEFDLSFAFLEPWNDDMMDDIIRWLNVDTYKPLFFEADIDRVFYAMPISDIETIHNGLKEGFINLTVRCDSAYSYSKYIETDWYDFNVFHDISPTYDGSQFINMNRVINGDRLFDENGDLTEFFSYIYGIDPITQIRRTNAVIMNLGHFTLLPEIWIEKVDKGDVIIRNNSNGGQEMIFTDMEIGEVVYVDCINEIVESSIEDKIHYDHFNDEYLEIVYGKNIIEPSSNVKLKFKYQYIYS